ncbi:ATP-binding protein [Saccharopolyspora griseoalba]|uniref:ATP-binding protein n=1 Tax=Saccharopolyspora griseoalba TaxID=1431848 RepID=A0ABW2LPF6_9PSEU
MGEARNEFAGTAGNVVQAGHISGGVHFHQPARPGVPVPRQLPARIAHFTDRTGPLARLDSWLDDAGDHAAAGLVVGSGGIGKSSLITHWAHRARERFPDGELFVDLRGYHDQGRCSADEALERLLRSLGVPGEELAIGTDAKAALYRSLLHGRRMLIVLDNAATADQVRPLLPGSPTCRVVVTSRSHLTSLTTGEGAHRMSLDVLPPEHALELLRSAAGAERIDAERDAAAELADYCGHLPLALRIAAERLAAAEHLGVAELVEELADERARLDALTTDDDAGAVRAVLSWSYRSLPAESARAFRLLGLVGGPDVELDTAAALLDLPRAGARRVLGALVGAHLLDEHRPKRYRFHDLTALYAAECAQRDEPAPERDAAVQRLLSWYLHAAIAAAWCAAPEFSRLPMRTPDPDVEVPEFADRLSALRWYDAERENLLAAVRLAGEREQHVHAWQLPTALFGLLLVRRPLADWIETHRIGLAAARALADQRAEAWLLTSSAIAHRHLRESGTALRELERAIELWQRTGPAWAHAWALRDLGELQVGMGRDAEADEVLERALAAHVELGDDYGEATTLSVLAKAEHRLGQHEEALDHLHRAIEIRRARGDARNEASCLHHIGRALGALGRTDEALTHLHRAIEQHEQLDSRFGEAEAREFLGGLLQDVGRSAEGREQLRLAAERYDELGVPHDLAS